MHIRTFAAAAAVSAIAVGLAAGPALADETSTTADVAAGQRACIELASSDPVRAEGVADRGVRFTLTLDGAVVAASGDDETNFEADSDGATVGAHGGTARLCADNLGREEAFVVLGLYSKEDDAAPAPVGAEADPAPEPPADDQPPAGDEPASLEQLIEAVVHQILAEAGL